MSEILRAALYIRVSHEEQAMHGYSLEAQQDALTEYAKANNYYIVDYYRDEGKSARKHYRKRSDFMRMLDDIKNNKIDLILFIKLDRWFRSIKDYYEVQTILDKNNVQWKAIHEVYDTFTANGRLQLNIKLSIAQDEADRTSERIKFVFENKIKRGEVITGSTPLGYKIVDKKLAIDPEMAAMVKDIFDYYMYKQSKSATIVYVRDKYNYTIHHNSLSRLLKKEIYTGNYRGVENYCEPLITEETYDTVQRIVKSNIKANKHTMSYIYTGLLRCPLCGRNLASGKTKTSEHVYNISYKCNGRYQDKTCTFSRHIGEKKIDTFLLNNIEKEIKAYIAKYEVKKKSKNSSIKIERDKLIKKIDKLKDLYMDDLISKDSYKIDYEKYMLRLNEIDSIQSEEIVDTDYLREFLNKDIKKIYATLSREDKQALWRSIIKEIHFTPKDLEPIIYFL